MGKKILLTGTSGSMGKVALECLLNSSDNFDVSILLRDKPSNRKYAKALNKKYKLKIIFGDFSNYEDCVKAIKDVEYVIHMGAIISPIADHDKEKTHQANYVGTKNIVDAIIDLGKKEQIKLVHISTVAVYGSRNYKHPWARVGDPILPASYDTYAMSKVMAERYVIDSGLKYWVVLRQTALLHDNLFKNNLKDGLMFHTNINGPLEWATAHDSGVLVEHLAEYDNRGELDYGFWRKCYNIGGGDGCRVTGYDTLNVGFGLCGARFEQMFRPNWNATKNFHGVWFSDSKDLDDILHFRSESCDDYWAQMAKKYWYFKYGKIVPKKWISNLVIKPLTKDTNAPLYWVNHKIDGRVQAFYGGYDEFNAIPSDWKDFPLLRNGETPEGKIDYERLRDKKYSDEYKLNHGYDETKPIGELDIIDMQQVAEFRGGKCLSTEMVKGDMYTKLTWQCNDGHIFEASPYLVAMAGHWCPTCSLKYDWDWARQVKNNPFYQQVWYDMNNKDSADTFPFSDTEDDFLRKE